MSTHKYTYEILFDVEDDAWNWLDGYAKSSHGVEWKKRIDPKVASELAALTPDDMPAYIYDYLQSLYIENKEMLKVGHSFVEKQYAKFFDQACDKLVEITGHPLCKDKFTIHLTTFPRAPYNYEQARLWFPVLWLNPIATFMHEILHFQTIKYWRDNVASTMSQLPVDKFETLKEALTVVLDESLMPPMERPDSGYAAHKELRAQLKKHWHLYGNFDDLVKQGVELVSKT